MLLEQGEAAHTSTSRCWKMWVQFITQVHCFGARIAPGCSWVWRLGLSVGKPAKAKPPATLSSWENNTEQSQGFPYHSPMSFPSNSFFSFSQAKGSLFSALVCFGLLLLITFLLCMAFPLPAISNTASLHPLFSQTHHLNSALCCHHIKKLS